jgi:hypothetical protein
MARSARGIVGLAASRPAGGTLAPREGQLRPQILGTADAARGSFWKKRGAHVPSPAVSCASPETWVSVSAGGAVAGGTYAIAAAGTVPATPFLSLSQIFIP